MAYLYGRLLGLKCMANNYGVFMWQIIVANICGKLLGLKIRLNCYCK